MMTPIPTSQTSSKETDMPRTSPNDLKRQQLEILARLTAMQIHLADALDALRDAQPGYPTATGGGGAPRLDSAGNPPGLDRYLNQPDPAANDLRLLVTSTLTMLNAATVAHDVVARWGVVSDDHHEGGVKPRRTASGGDCVACSTYCSGAHNDRLRAGLCLACYQDSRRSTLERGDWMLERRRNLLTERVEEVA
jgi:hypothetical protein